MKNGPETGMTSLGSTGSMYAGAVYQDSLLGMGGYIVPIEKDGGERCSVGKGIGEGSFGVIFEDTNLLNSQQ